MSAHKAPVEPALKTLVSLTGAISKPGEKLLIFQCYGGTHSSVTAASVHLNLLPRNRVPTYRELTALPYFDRIENNEVGPLRYMGSDQRGFKVYILGSRCWGKEIKDLLKILTPLLGISSGEILFLNCFDLLNWVARAGGFLSRRWGLPAIGRPLVCYGIRLGFRRIVRRVELLGKRPELFSLID